MNKFYTICDTQRLDTYREGYSQPVMKTTSLTKSLEMIVELYVNIVKSKTKDPKTRIIIHQQLKAIKSMIQCLNALDIPCDTTEITASLLGFTQKHIESNHSV